MKKVVMLIAAGLLLSGCTINHYHYEIQNSNIGMEPAPIIIPEDSELMM